MAVVERERVAKRDREEANAERAARTQLFADEGANVRG